MAKFQIDPAGPPVQRAPPPPPPAPAAPPAAPPPSPAKAPAPSRTKLVLLSLAAVVLLGSGATVGALWAFDLGPFSYPDRYLLAEDEMPPGLRLQALPPQVREEFGIQENPDQMPPETIDETFEGDTPEEVWVESVGTGRLGEQVVIVAARYATEAEAQDAAASEFCPSGDGDGVVMREGRVVVVLLSFTDAGARRVPVVEAAIREKAPGLSVECRW